MKVLQIRGVFSKFLCATRGLTMVPFRVFDKEKKEMWIVLNYHPGASQEGNYLVAREDDSEKDGELQLISATSLAKFKLVDFLEEDNGYDE